MFEYIFDVLFVLMMVTLIDFYFVGIIPLLFTDDVFFNPLKINCKYKLVAQIIDTNCNDSNKVTKRIVKYFQETNSRLAFCDEGIFIGKKYLSYAYKLKYEEIIDVELEIKNFFIFKVANIKIILNSDDGQCFYLIKYIIVISRNKNKLDNIKNYILENISR